MASTRSWSRLTRGAIPGARRTLARSGALVLAVNRNASGLEDPEKTGRRAGRGARGAGRAGHPSGSRAASRSCGTCCARPRRADQRVVLVGGDGTVHAAANAPLRRAARAGAGADGSREQRRARARHPASRGAAPWPWPPGAPARPIDALRVATPDRFIYAVEAVSAGFQAEARAGYDAENSADLMQGLRALVRAVRRYRPYARERRARRSRRPTVASASDGSAARACARRTPLSSSSRTFPTSASASRSTRAPIRRTAASRRSSSRPAAAAGCCGCSPPPGAAGTSAGAACRACPRPAPA